MSSIRSLNRNIMFYTGANPDAFVKSPKTLFSVIPAEAGIQAFQGLLDPI
jgi:hypothetical protein